MKAEWITLPQARVYPIDPDDPFGLRHRGLGGDEPSLFAQDFSVSPEELRKWDEAYKAAKNLSPLE